MEKLLLGIAMTVLAGWLVFALRERGERHRLFRIPGMDLLLPVGLLSLLVFGVALIFNGSENFW